ncbi:hypothetical protein N9D52_06615 [Flavobacteriaceae bacterium]|nr:hypothetical protein [Flavobacteriaceae bacterium]
MKNHKLIEGSFSDEEAKDVLKNFFESKIHFHEMRNFSSLAISITYLRGLEVSDMPMNNVK